MEPQKLFIDLDSSNLEVVENAKVELLRVVGKTKESWMVSQIV